jgi:hypothetical protein
MDPHDETPISDIWSPQKKNRPMSTKALDNAEPPLALAPEGPWHTLSLSCPLFFA